MIEIVIELEIYSIWKSPHTKGHFYYNYKVSLN